jgi:hypothetical protein
MRTAHLLAAGVVIAAAVGFAIDARHDQAVAAPEPDQPQGLLPPGHPSIDDHGRAAPAPAEVAPAPVEPVEPARGPNAKRIAAVFAERDALAGGRVRVRGLVVRTIDGIRGMTYSHLQDGSGSAERADHDLTVTTKSSLEKGRIVTLEGTLQRDVDLGAGYRYRALLADAEIVEE